MQPAAPLQHSCGFPRFSVCNKDIHNSPSEMKNRLEGWHVNEFHGDEETEKNQVM